MSQIASEAKIADSPLGGLYAPVASQLAEVEALLREELQSEHRYVDELIRHGCLMGGKRLRPLLLLLCGQAVGDVTREHLVLAAVIEMIHTATLVHDDVLDEADVRRHLATVNSRWDNKASVLLGDYLFTHAFFLATRLRSTLACRAIGRATNLVCEGELRQKGTRGDFAVNEEEYLEIISAKTAELCACSCYLGANFAGASEESAERLAQFGRDLGVAFQIVDDVLDVKGDESKVGKSLGTDLQQQKPTLPIIRVLQAADVADRRDVLAILNSEGSPAVESLIPFFQRYRAFDYSYDTAREFTQRARQRLAGLRPSAARQALEMLTEFVVDRSL